MGSFIFLLLCTEQYDDTVGWSDFLEEKIGYSPCCSKFQNLIFNAAFWSKNIKTRFWASYRGNFFFQNFWNSKFLNNIHFQGPCDFEMKTLLRMRCSRKWSNLQNFWNRTSKNVSDRQQCVHFRKSQKILFHSTRLYSTWIHNSHIICFVSFLIPNQCTVMILKAYFCRKSWIMLSLVNLWMSSLLSVL